MQIVALMMYTITLSKSDDSEASKSILQISDIMGRNRVKRGFHCNGSKISLQ